MNTDNWARGAIKSEPKIQDYVGLSYEEASQRAQSICRAAGENGQTIKAESHLSILCEILRVTHG